MRRFVFLVLLVACHSQEEQQRVAPVVTPPVASATETPSAAPIAPLASAVVDGTGKLTIDAGKIDKDAERRARLERQLEAQQLQILAVLGAPSDAGSLLRNDVPPVDLSEVATSPRSRTNDLRLGTGSGGGAAIRGGGIADLRDTRDR